MTDVVQVVPFQGAGGMQQVAHVLDESLPRHGLTSQVRALRPSQHVRPSRVATLRQWRGLVRLWRRERPRAVIGHAPLTSAVALTAAAVAKVPHRLAVVHENAHHLGASRRLLTVLVRMGVVTRLVAVGPAVGDSLIDLDPRVAPHVAVIVNGVPAADVALAPDALRPTRAEAGITVITAGRLVPGKNIELLVRAAAASTCAVDLVVCGDGPERAALEALSQHLGLDVRFTGMLDQESLRESYAAADLFAFPSRSEGLPLVLVEAAAAGLPVLASRVPGNLDVLGDAAEYLPTCDDATDRGTVARWAAALDRLASDPCARDAMRRAALLRMPSFSPSRMAEDYAQLFRGPARAARGGRRQPPGAADPSTDRPCLPGQP